MKDRGMYALITGLATLVFAALIVTFIVILSTNENMNRPEAPLAKETVAEENAFAPRAPAEGIGVHGHWTLEVRNPDGSLVERRTFENALTDEGEITLPRILGRQRSVGGWDIRLLSPPGSGMEPFLSSRGLPGIGVIIENTFSGTEHSEPYVFKTLTLTTELSDSRYKLVLRGTATAQRNGIISSVSTGVSELVSTQPPSGNYGSSLTALSRFTEALLPSEINVTAGQSITVIVEISFS